MGDRRLICVPDARLGRVQRWIAKYVLSRVAPHSASFAYAPGSSPIECARMHCGCRWMLKVDVKGFFESISEIQAYRVYKGLGYNELVSFELARLCSRRFRKTPRLNRRVWMAKGTTYTIGKYVDSEVGHLPQGAPTSPMLSNLVMRDLDHLINLAAERLGFVYTRYSDDLTFSSSSSNVGRSDILALLSEVSSHLRANGLNPNRDKTKLVPPGARKIVLGLLVDREVPRLQREFKDRLMLHAHFVSKHGYATHAANRKFRSTWSFIRHLDGLIAYASHVDPEFADRIRVVIRGVARPA